MEEHNFQQIVRGRDRWPLGCQMLLNRVYLFSTSTSSRIALIISWTLANETTATLRIGTVYKKPSPLWSALVRSDSR